MSNYTTEHKIIWSDESDAWYMRNKIAKPSKEIFDAYSFLDENFYQGCAQTRVLEIGCSDGRNGQKLNGFDISYVGVDPSSAAVEQGRLNGLNLVRGMAHEVNLQEEFDVVILGFFLYLANKSDWIPIVHNVNKHLKDKGFIIIKDFFSASFKQSTYGHNSALKVNKFDYTNLFTWHPDYCEIYRKMSSSAQGLAEKENFIQTSILQVDKR